jgi:hypothetical protein
MFRPKHFGLQANSSTVALPYLRPESIIYSDPTHKHPTSLFFLNNVTQIFYLMSLNVASFLYFVHFHLSKNDYNGDLK